MGVLYGRGREGGEPALRPLVQKYAAGSMVDLVGFWAVWHLEGGFEGLLRMGMSRASVYRRVKLFRMAFGAHPDEFGCLA